MLRRPVDRSALSCFLRTLLSARSRSPKSSNSARPRGAAAPSGGALELLLRTDGGLARLRGDSPSPSVVTARPRGGGVAVGVGVAGITFSSRSHAAITRASRRATIGSSCASMVLAVPVTSEADEADGIGSSCAPAVGLAATSTVGEAPHQLIALVELRGACLSDLRLDIETVVGLFTARRKEET